MTRDRVTTFRNARCRFLRTSEGRWRAGWTQHLAHDSARLKLKAFVALRPDEEVIGECYGDGALVRFAGRVVGQMGQELAVRIVGSLGFETSHESIRIEVEGLQGTLTTDEGTFELIVTDVSPESLGGFTSAFLGIGTVHALTLRADGEPIQCRVGVVNCRLDPEGAESCRVGLRIVEAGRLDAARWSRLVAAMSTR